MFAGTRPILPKPFLAPRARLRLALWLAALPLIALPAVAQAAGSVYVTSDDSISQYAIGAGGRLSPLSPATVAAEDGGAGAVVTPDAKSVYVTGGHSVLQYNVDPATGALSPKTPPAVATTSDTLGTYGLAVTPNGNSAYVTGGEPHGGSHLLRYDIDVVSGALSLTVGEIGTGFIPGAVAVTPNGRSAYVTDIFGGALQYDIDPVSGALSPKTPTHVITGKYAESVAVTPDGRSAYFGNFDNSIPNNTVAQFDIDPVSGVLSPKTPATVVTGPRVVFIAVTPDGRSAYVSSAGGPLGSSEPGSVWQYDIDPGSGALSPKTPPIVATGGAPYGIAVTPDGKSAYVTNGKDSNVWQFDIDPANGALSPKTPAVVATGEGPYRVVVGPLPRAPTATKQCKQDGWLNFPQFKNLGQCVAFVERRKESTPPR